MKCSWGIVVAAAIALVGCIPPQIPTMNVAAVPPSERAAAAKVRVFPPGAATEPTDFDYVGPVEGNSCKHLLWDPPASQSDALEQMRINALRMSATAVMDFTCTMASTDVYGTNCWNSVHCGGTAVRTK
ncbi:MAG TPA: Rcs stress response system protein RcsF [Stellaceae bacterium]|nr:Rcs stress response system protein RcsF [Stellaceae bacterium]